MIPVQKKFLKIHQTHYFASYEHFKFDPKPNEKKVKIPPRQVSRHIFFRKKIAHFTYSMGQTISHIHPICLASPTSLYIARSIRIFWRLQVYDEKKRVIPNFDLFFRIKGGLLKVLIWEQFLFTGTRSITLIIRCFALNPLFNNKLLQNTTDYISNQALLNNFFFNFPNFTCSTWFQVSFSFPIRADYC